MSRVNVWVPNELLKALRDQCPEAVMSRIVQDAIRSALGCAHQHGLACVECGAEIDRGAVELAAMERLWRAASDRIERIPAPGTAVGAHKMLRDTAALLGVSAAARATEWRRPRAS